MAPLAAGAIFLASGHVSARAQGPSPSPSQDSDTASAAPDVNAFKSEAEAATVTIAFNISDRAAGATGFITEYKGKKYVVTNIHVLRGEAQTEAEMIWNEGPRDRSTMATRLSHLARIRSSYQEFQKLLAQAPLPKIQTSSGDTLCAGTSLLLSTARDIALIPVETDIKPLDIAFEQPKRDEQMFVVGNPEAEHTISILDGSIKAVGPEKIELAVSSGELVPGMSGGPVVSTATGKVLGAIAYKVEDFKRSDGKISVESIKIEGGPAISRFKCSYELKVRNFAFRIDNATDFQTISWFQLLADCGTFHAMKERSLNIATASKAPYDHFNASGIVLFEIPPDFDSSVAMAYRSAMRSLATMSASDFDRNWKSYQANLGSLINQDLKNPKNRIFTPYMQNLVRTDLSAERAGICTELQASAGKVPSRSAR